MELKASSRRSSIQTHLFPITQTVGQAVIDKNVEIKYNKIDSHSAQIGGAGGGSQEDNSLTNIFYRGDEKKDQTTSTLMKGRMVKTKYETVDKHEQNPFCINPSNYNSFPELCIAVEGYLSDWESFTESYLSHVMRYARLMSDTKSTPFPIDFFNLSYTQYIYHMKWYKENCYNNKTGENFYGLKHRKDAINAFRLAYGEKSENWHYKLPHAPKRKTRHIPPPDIVHKIITYNFFPKNQDRTNLYQYIHAHNFWIGPRPPSELCLMTIDDFNWDEGYIDAREQKIHCSMRTIYPEQAILTGKTRKSFKNYIDYVRPKFVSQYSGNALYINTEGKPFTPRHLGKELSQTGKMAYPLFKTYVARHWCATARLIKAWLNRDPDPIDLVMHFMGHEERKTTEGYVEQARVLFKKYPFDWIKRTLKFPKKWIEESALKSKQRPKTLVSHGNSPRKISGPAEI